MSIDVPGIVGLAQDLALGGITERMGVATGLRFQFKPDRW
jgi:hypothetical protein